MTGKGVAIIQVKLVTRTVERRVIELCIFDVERSMQYALKLKNVVNVGRKRKVS